MNHKFTGTGVALVTPFLKDKQIDYPALAGIIDHIITGKTEYIVLLGTTGESVTVSREERENLIRFVRESVHDRLPLVLGIGGNNTMEVIRQLESTDLTGYTAILSVCPYYNKPQQDGIYAHYAALAQSSPLPLILYNVPGRTGSNMTAATTLRLAYEYGNIIAIKEASGNLAQIMEILKEKPEDFLLISGDDNLTLPMIALGASGVISVTAQVKPRPFSDMVRFCLAGDMEKARKLHFELLGLMSLLFADGSPAGVKAALHILGLCENELRLPLVPVNEAVYKNLLRILHPQLH
ncbi:MAG TPA: 4-hydroxy-tetrahydrodipicolinate synthase [Bacteroidales bacterium]|nr:4-hydroxy-tetrahydrodipicolinate synthase [Bacteroidales bacterium]HSA42694.1 4-hydroxy-tetrahydrodipicolinate synthase [Bacteroidales bacterium]